jgi:hypothetical protein
VFGLQMQRNDKMWTFDPVIKCTENEQVSTHKGFFPLLTNFLDKFMQEPRHARGVWVLMSCHEGSDKWVKMEQDTFNLGRLICGATGFKVA